MILSIISFTIDKETIETTPEHPFYVMANAPWLQSGETEGRWVNAGELEVGHGSQPSLVAFPGEL